MMAFDMFLRYHLKITYSQNPTIIRLRATSVVISKDVSGQKVKDRRSWRNKYNRKKIYEV